MASITSWASPRSAAGVGWASGFAQAWRKASSLGVDMRVTADGRGLTGSMLMSRMLMFVGLVRRDVPAAVVASRRLFVTRVAQERAAFEVLLQAVLILLRQVPRVARQGQG